MKHGGLPAPSTTMHTKTAEKLFMAAIDWQEDPFMAPMRCPKDGRKLVPHWDTNLFELYCPQCHYIEHDLNDRQNVIKRYERLMGKRKT